MSRRSITSPNIIVFFTDQQRWDSTGLHGNPLGLTPNLDRMARRGTHIYNSITCQPVCAPARASLQTGQYATRTGVFRNGIALDEKAITLARCFRSAGYRTGYIGKWHLASSDPVDENQRGGYGYWLGANLLEFVSEPYHTILYNNDNEPVALPGYRVDALTDAAIRYVADNQGNPFFLFLSYLEPHHQNHVDDYVAPNGYREQYTARWTPPDLSALGGSAPYHLGGYWGMVKRLDEALGRLMDALQSMNRLENTIVLFTSDHGCHFKTRNTEYKRSCHEASVRVPTVFYGPAFNGGGQIEQLVSLVDLPPTLLDVAGIAVPDSMDGHSIMPLVRHEATDWPQEVLIQISETQVGRALRTHRWKYGVIAPEKDPWQDSGSDTYVEECLYDLEYDPYELTNLIGLETYAEVATDLRQRLLTRMVEAGENEAVIELAPTRPSGQRSPMIRPPHTAQSSDAQHRD